MISSSEATSARPRYVPHSHLASYGVGYQFLEQLIAKNMSAREISNGDASPTLIRMWNNFFS